MQDMRVQERVTPVLGGTQKAGRIKFRTRGWWLKQHRNGKYTKVYYTHSYASIWIAIEEVELRSH